MNNRLKLVLVLGTLILFSMTMTACNRERPALTTGTPAARATVAGPTAVVPATTQVAMPTAIGGGTSGVSTPSAPQTQSEAAAPQAAAPTAAVASGGRGTTTYTVQSGDTLLDIAVRFGTTTEAIAQLNSLPDPDSLILGQKLIIPGAETTAGSATSGGTTAAGSPTTYTVQQGDTLGSIARRFGTTVQELATLNKLANANNIAIGQVLKLPSGSSEQAGAAEPTESRRKTYVIQRGDTLLSIAREYGLTVKQLAEANNIADPDRIFPGQTLVIP